MTIYVEELYGRVVPKNRADRHAALTSIRCRARKTDVACYLAFPVSVCSASRLSKPTVQLSWR